MQLRQTTQAAGPVRVDHVATGRDGTTVRVPVGGEGRGPESRGRDDPKGAAAAMRLFWKELAYIVAVLVAVGVLVTVTAVTGKADTTGCRLYVAGWPDQTGTTAPDGWTGIDTGGIFWWENNGPYDVGQARGTTNLITAADQAAAHCDDIWIHGHSYGAAVVATAVPTLAGRDYADHLHITTTGNPRRTGGIEDRLPGLLPGITMRGAVENPGLDWTDICQPHDGICDWTLGGVFGYFTGAHRYAWDGN